jgi:Zn-dependent protease
MEEFAAQKNAPAVMTEIPRYSTTTESGDLVAGQVRIPRLHLVLFFLTLLTTTMAGAIMAGEDFLLAHPVSLLLGLMLHPFSTIALILGHPISTIASLSSGLSFSLPLMAILLAHEMGHYVTARHHGVETTLPFFIPAPPDPFIIGTFGAFIRMKSMPRTRRVMFDIGAAGPWAGVALAIPAVVVGLWLSDVVPLDKSSGGLELGNSLLFMALQKIVLGVDPLAVNVNLHPIAFAGWLGLLVTTLNLLPVGQLDGGHVVYALFPRRHRTISVLFVVSCVLMVIVPLALGKEFWGGWLLWAVLSVALGLGHPSTIDRDTPLNPRRAVAAWMTVALFVVTFSPVPLSFTVPEPKPPPEQGDHVQEVIHPAPHYDRMLQQISTVRI